MRAILLSILLAVTARGEPVKFDNVSAKSGPWSDPATWDGKPPQAGARVQVHAGHVVTYDVESADALRLVHVAGTLTFSREKNTRMEVGLLRVTPGGECSEDGFDCHDDAPVEKGEAVPKTLEHGILMNSFAVWGCCGAAILVLILALPPLISPPEDVHRVASGMFAISYSCAVIVPVVGGVLWDLTGWHLAPFIPIVICMLVVIGLAPTIVLREKRAGA